MPLNVKLLPGTYRFTTTNPVSIVIYEVTEDGILTTFGTLLWLIDPDGGHYERGAIGITPHPDGTFNAVNGAENIAGTWLKIA